MMELDWEKVYGKKTIKEVPKGVDLWELPPHIQKAKLGEKKSKKFDNPINPIPWSLDYEENVLMTLEWLIRDHRKEVIRLQKKPLHTHVREFWYHRDYDPGFFAHVCFPKDLLTYRNTYDDVYAQWLKASPSNMSTHVLEMQKKLRGMLWTQWRCTGMDGSWDLGDQFDDNLGEVRLTYNYRCSRCGSEMPKSVKMYVKLTQGVMSKL